MVLDDPPLAALVSARRLLTAMGAPNGTHVVELR